MTVQLLHGDCRDVLRTLADGSVHCCITSPPYWGLRSYLPAGHPDKAREIGSEPTVHEWVRTMVEVFREVRRVLRDDGTLWLNLGDSYYGGGRGGDSGSSTMRSPQPSHSKHQAFTAEQRNASARAGRCRESSGLKPKDLIGQPWRVAFALQEDGWYLRQELIWAKRNPMPESVTDRFTKAHEQVFLLSKSERYWFDLAAVQEEASEGTHARYAQNGGKAPQGAARGFGDAPRAHKASSGYQKGKGVGRRQGPPGNPAENEAPNPKAALADTEIPGAYADGKSERMGRGAGWRKLAENGSGTKTNASFDEAMAVMPAKRNPRDVRWLASEPFKGAHFATYPPSLIEPFVLAGCPEGGTILDPFGGSGTTGLVADRHHRNAILIDIDERNLPMARERIQGDAPLFAEFAA